MNSDNVSFVKLWRVREEEVRGMVEREEGEGDGFSVRVRDE